MSRVATHPEAMYAVRKYFVPRGATRFGYHRFPWRWISSCSLAKQLRKFGPEAISAHCGLPVAFFLSSARPNCPWSITCHGEEVSRKVWVHSMRQQYGVDEELGRSLNAASSIIAISGVAELSLLELGVRQEKLKRIPNGVDTALFQKTVHPARLETVGVTGTQFLLSVGRNVPQKNLSLGLNAFAMIARKYPSVHYLVVGRGCSLLKDLVMRLGLAGRVTLSDGLHGDDLVAAYQRALAMVSPSVWEFSPLVVLEAMAAGLPQVATDVPGTRDFVFDGETGFIAKANEPESLAAAVERLLGSEVIRRQMKANCVRRSREYDWTIIAKANLEAILAKPSAPHAAPWQWKRSEAASAVLA